MIFNETASVREELLTLQKQQDSDWQDLTINADTFTKLQQKVLPEFKYLKDFWEENEINNKKFWAWNCLPAYDDIPVKYRFRTMPNCCKYCNVSKYEVLHDREEYLENLLTIIWSLFHDWQFITQGWTAY